MATVYLAEDLKHGRKVAIKLESGDLPPGHPRVTYVSFDPRFSPRLMVNSAAIR